MILYVTADISAVQFRPLSSFEWVVLSLLDTFSTGAPTIADATAQLCIGEPAFLAAALENLRSAGAIRPGIDQTHTLELRDYELTEAGRAIFQEDGWEINENENLTEEISLDWPTLKVLTNSNNRERGERKESAPLLDEVQKKLTAEKIEEWLNLNDTTRCWRVKSFFVTRAER